MCPLIHFCWPVIAGSHKVKLAATKNLLVISLVASRQSHVCTLSGSETGKKLVFEPMSKQFHSQTAPFCHIGKNDDLKDDITEATSIFYSVYATKMFLKKCNCNFEGKQSAFLVCVMLFTVS